MIIAQQLSLLALLASPPDASPPDASPPDPAAAQDTAPETIDSEAQPEQPESGVEQPTPEPGVEQPTPEPGVEQPTPGVEQPTPEPGVEQPTPEPGVEQPTPTVDTLVEGPAAPPTPEHEGPPYYSEEDMDALRERYDISEDPRVEPRKPKWRCMIPDPACGFGIELSATTAYTYRTRQGNISIDGSFFEWNSARVAYDVWFNFPAHVQTMGSYKFTRLTLGPKLAVVASDNQDLWANMGIALRYWFGVGKWSPALEFTSALSFKLAGLDDDLFETERSPIGLSADIGINVGGWGALIVGGQYDSPLAREEIPEKFRVSAAGQVFVGFRGNILWGAPAAAAVATHVAISRTAPPQP